MPPDPAALTGRTVGSVNERLREARRKTGAASSRELARVLAALQQNRDELVGVASGGDGPASGAGTAPSRRRYGVLAMLTLPAAALLLFQLCPAPAPPADPLTDPFTELGASAEPARAVRARLLAEGRDPGWALATEAALRERYLTVAGVGGPAGTLRVTCGRTLCEVVARSPLARRRQVGSTWRALQTDAFVRGVAALGLSDVQASFAVPPGGPQLAYLAYWARSPAASARP